MDYYDKEKLKLEQERNRILKRIADELGAIRKALPLKRMIVPVLSGQEDGSGSVWGVRELGYTSTEKKEDNENE